ncbi:MAG: rod shape-determining protein MreC [Clostridia bacterium]|nr:rod shape-determining protein MreC [Clostridia bacterium]
MARPRRGQRSEKDPRPVATDDFIYEQTEDDSVTVLSDTPEEAVRKLRVRTDRENDNSVSSEENDQYSGESRPVPNKRKVYSSGVILDDNLEPVGKVKRRSHPVLRGFILTIVTLVLLVTAGSFILRRLFPDTAVLGAPENAVSSIMTPIQTFFSGITESIAGYFRSMKLRSNIESEYNALRAENEQLVYKAMLAEELQQTLSMYEDLSDEIKANQEMKPIVATVVGRSDTNYFSTMTINKGTNDGVEDYMAVTISGALVGYTENTRKNEATVRTIIDSNASIAAIIQSSRDQGTVRGTLGVDGAPMCRMYYLPDDNLPRPGDLVVTSGVGMSFPKGIPIGEVRESTRGMDSNKQYIIIEPKVDFQHLEYVIVLRYKPRAEAIEGRENGRTDIELVPLESARPSPVVPQIAASLFDSPTPDPVSSSQITPSPTPEPTEIPKPTLTPTVTPQPTPDETILEYQVVNLHGDPTPTPSPTPGPTATPYFTPDPNDMTFEEDE